MLVDLYASQPQYADHAVAVWNALDPAVKGDTWAASASRWWGPRRPRNHPTADRVTLIAGWADAEVFGSAPLIYVEHGAGQTYSGLSAVTARHYPGGDHPANVVGYIAPSVRVARSWHGRPAVAVGCPRLDRWLPDPPVAERRTLAVAFHWNCHLLPETRGAGPHYARALPALVAGWRAAGWEVLGHGHPRDRAFAEHLWRDCGVRPVWDSAEILERASLLIADNTSLAYEAAALDRRVLMLNAPWWRRHVDHGLRFWDMVPGWQVDSPGELAHVDLAAYVDDDPTSGLRAKVMDEVYAFRDGRSAQRAARFVESLIGDTDGNTVHR